MKYVKRAASTFILILFLLFSLKIYIKTENFEKLLTNILSMSGLKIEFTDVELQGFNKLFVENIKVKDMKNNVVIDAKTLEAKINLTMPSRLLRIDINDAVVNLERSKNNHFNIFDVIKKGEKPKKITYDRASRIGKLYINNATLNYSDISYKNKILKELHNVNGFLETSKSRGFILEAKGTNKTEKIGIELSDVLNAPQNLIKSVFDDKPANYDKRKNFYVNFIFGDVKLNENLGQFVPLNLIKIKDGKLNGKISINNYNPNRYLRVIGKLEIKNGTLFYTDYSDDIKNIDTKIDLGLEKIKVDGISREKNDEKIKLELNFDTIKEILDLKLGLENVPFEKIKKYKTINDLKIEAKGNVNGNLLLNYKLKEKEFDLKSKFNSHNIQMIGYNFRNLKAEMNLSKDMILAFKNIKFDFDEKINNFRIKNNVLLNEFIYDINKKYGEGKYLLNNSGSDYSIDKIYGTLKIDKNNIIYGTATSNSLDGNYKIIPESLLVEINTKAKKIFDINYNNQKYGISPNISNMVLDLKSKTILKSGNIDTKLKLYNKNPLILDLNANLKSENNKIIGNYNLFSEYGNQIIEYENLEINGKINDLLSLNIDVNGKIDELWLGYQRLKNVNALLNINNGIVNINNIFNDKINVNGLYNLNNGYMNINSKLNNYILYNTFKPELNILVNNLQANINGTVNKLNGNIIFEPSKTYVDSLLIGTTKGNINIENSVLNIKELTLRENSLTGQYNLNNGNTNLELVVKEKNIPQLLNNKDLTVGTNSKFKLQGKLDNFDLKGNINLDNISYKTYKIPEIDTEIEYKNGDINNLLKKGIVDVKKLTFIGENKEELFTTKTNFDLEKIDINYELQNQSFVLDSYKDLKEKGYSGEVKWDFLFRGKERSFFTDLKVKSDNLVLSGFKVNNLDIDTQANNDGLNIGQFYLEYENNPLLLNGYLGFKPINYDMSLLAENFNLEFLGLDKDVSEAKGNANINLLFSNKGSSGDIKLDNFSYKTKDGVVKAEDINVNINLANNMLNINRLNGGYNDGKFDINGNLDVPTIPEDFFKTKKVKLGKLNLNANLDNVGLRYGEDIDFHLTGDVVFTEDNLFGTININSGEVKSIPTFGNEEKNLTETEKEELLAKKTIVEGFVEEVIDKIMKQYTVNLAVHTSKDFKLNIPSVSLVRGIRADILGTGNILYQNDKVDILGNYSLRNGSFTLNGNKFNIENVDVRFTDANSSLSELNPFINFEAKTIIKGEEVTVSLNGYFNESEIKLKSSSGYTKEQILSLLAFNIKDEKNSEGVFVENRTEDKNAALVSSLVDTTLNQLIFSPVTGKIEEIFGLTALRINTNFQRENSEQASYVGLTKVYMQGNAYKNKVYWNAELKFPFKNGNENSEINNQKDFIGYNLWLNYKLPNGFSARMGGETINKEEQEKIEVTTGKSINKLRKGINYYIGFDFSNKANTFKELIRKIFPKRKIDTLEK